MFSVFSEIGKLKKVLVHTPGPEVDQMPPALMDKLLFDDLLYGEIARQEHAYFCKVMTMMGVDVVDLQTLFEEAAEAAPTEFRQLVDRVISFERLSTSAAARLQAMENRELARTLVLGMLVPQEDMAPDRIYSLIPVPNLLFARDPQFIIGDQIVFSAMKENARKREPLISSFAFKHHPDFNGCNVLHDASRRGLDRSFVKFGSGTIEGGDVLVLKEGVVLIGISDRTTEYGAELLIQALRKHGQFHSVILVSMPSSRAQMHLDTIFTRVSQSECLIYSPMIAPNSAETLSAITIDLRDRHDSGRRKPSLLDALRDLGIALEPIYCGGRDDYIQQSREQWTDGANAFVIRPSMIIMYDRNVATIKELERHGYCMVRPEDLKSSSIGDVKYEIKEDGKYCFLIPSNELSRARGGPRCMTMPLLRESIS